MNAHYSLYLDFITIFTIYGNEFSSHVCQIQFEHVNSKNVIDSFYSFQHVMVKWDKFITILHMSGMPRQRLNLILTGANKDYFLLRIMALNHICCTKFMNYLGLSYILRSTKLGTRNLFYKHISLYLHKLQISFSFSKPFQSQRVFIRSRLLHDCEKKMYGFCASIVLRIINWLVCVA